MTTIQKRVFPMTKMKGFAFVSNGQPKKNRVGSLLKRFVSHVTKDRAVRKNTLLWNRRKRNRDSSEREQIQQAVLSQQFLPEILRVSPMVTSCEVTLISSEQDGPGTDQITVTHDGKSEIDDSCYHLVLNPHRKPYHDFFSDDEDEQDDDNFEKDYYNDVEGELGSSAVTHDMTTTESSTCLNETTNHKTPTLPENEDENNQEETIYFMDAERYHRDRHEVLERKDTVFYKSLFVASDTEDDEDDDDADMDQQFWENYPTWRYTTEDRCFHESNAMMKNCTAPTILSEKQQLLNTTIDTELLEEEDSDDSTYRDEDLPAEITVQF